MTRYMKLLLPAFAAAGAAIAVAATPASAAAPPNPQTGCIGGNNMMPAPGMSTQGWATLPDSNPGLDHAGNGMVTAMIVSDPLWPIMCTAG